MLGKLRNHAAPWAVSDESQLKIDPVIREMAERFIAEGVNKRAILVLSLLLQNGSVTTAEIQAQGYDHPPRAFGDVRDAGFPLLREWFTDEQGRRMGRYRFGSSENIRAGRFHGRIAIPKPFRNRLLAYYGGIDCITGASLPATMLQVDHRIPYRVTGDPEVPTWLVEDFMLLDASSQRSKSWSCENCKNWKSILDTDICRTCFWAFPERYTHVAMEEVRRTDVVWHGSDIHLHDRIKNRADAEGITIAEALLRLIRNRVR